MTMSMSGKPAKHVRFAYPISTFHSKSPKPQPSRAQPSSTTHPRTHHGHPKPPHYSSSSSRRSIHIRLHSYLKTSAVTWDLRNYPPWNTWNYYLINEESRSEPATNPPLKFMTISSPLLPWTIKVRSSKFNYISLDDVITTLFLSLRTNIGPEDFYSLRSENDRVHVVRAYEQRYRRHNNSKYYYAEKCGGIKRVDFLLGYSRFIGLSNAGSLHKWELNVSRQLF